MNFEQVVKILRVDWQPLRAGAGRDSSVFRRIPVADIKEKLGPFDIKPVKGGAIFRCRCDEHEYAVVGGIKLFEDGVEELQIGLLLVRASDVSDAEWDQKLVRSAEGTAIAVTLGVF